MGFSCLATHCRSVCERIPKLINLWGTVAQFAAAFLGLAVATRQRLNRSNAVFRLCATAKPCTEAGTATIDSPTPVTRRAALANAVDRIYTDAGRQALSSRLYRN
ncbi:uncharacterized protein L969DRAFT_94760 [Mixia osmundae IAM 14324]|uniref:Uncharacterized protein n=1 Tax=Mixia osmundae (strain CBS 9802 / IAM 14324 / JCM 22182 / KY 12970) TaxID=764103 RepID=G7E459_MIXOS|nr:uncharacterized protein L969DRAFT_94760 [Mixia osmundae IAM 14324]KEI39715.1 hypothetical protein L969DRAFT_94760 [Mixia osmundae IAM 14324]GAA97619.1 hypothetical protein E5Q_04297 [Mixia osmundae IAM 14324]